MVADKFRSALEAVGLSLSGPISGDGKLHRFHVGGDRPRTENGWYLLFDDESPAGAFGCWKRGISETWSARPAHTLSEAEKTAQRAKFEAARKERERLQTEVQTQARRRAAEIWQTAKPAHENHPYLIRKGIHPHGAKESRGSLVLSLRDTSGTLHGLQFINEAGEKRYLTGTAKKGCYFALGGKPGSVLYLCEGFATGASIQQASGGAVAVCFDSGNLLPVAEALHEKYPALQIILCGDNDQWTTGNPGATKAREAAMAVGGAFVVPQFPQGGANG